MNNKCNFLVRVNCDKCGKEIIVDPKKKKIRDTLKLRHERQEKKPEIICEKCLYKMLGIGV